MVCNESRKKHDASLITEINNKSFEINDLKAQLQEKSIVVNELKQLLTKFKGKSHVTPCETPNPDSMFQKLEDENVPLDFQLKAKFSKQIVNQEGTSRNTKFEKPSTTGNKLYDVAKFPKTKFIPKLVEKHDLSKIVTLNLNTNKVIEKCAKVLALCLLRIDSKPINAYFRNNKVVHQYYLKITKEHTKILQELLEQARALNPSDENLDYACNFA
ncbi:hypothetical protein Tco_1385439 [Tanacetum coccineum]